jgi:hypothetical protein
MRGSDCVESGDHAFYAVAGTDQMGAVGLLSSDANLALSVDVPSGGSKEQQVRRQQKSRIAAAFLFCIWCPGEDSNLHGFTR